MVGKIIRIISNTYIVFLILYILYTVFIVFLYVNNENTKNYDLFCIMKCSISKRIEKLFFLSCFCLIVIKELWDCRQIFVDFRSYKTMLCIEWALVHSIQSSYAYNYRNQHNCCMP